MRLFWKFLCGMAAITALACGLGGYLLIDAQFRGGLEQEVAALYEENDLLRYAVTRELGEREDAKKLYRILRNQYGDIYRTVRKKAKAYAATDFLPALAYRVKSADRR